MTHDAFISYSSDDKALADGAVATLERRGIRCWVAPRDVPAGVPWASALVDAIRSSTVLVLILSEGSNRSAQVIREVDEAVSDGIPILPLRIDDVEPSEELRYYIKSVHWLDALSPPMQRHLDHLADSVTALLSVPGDGPRASGPQVAQPTQRRTRRGWVAGLAGLTAVAIVGGGAWFISARREAPATAPQQDAVVAESSESPASATPWTGFEWRHNPDSGHYYALTDTGMSPDMMEDLAEQTGGHLVAISDVAEEKWLNSTFGQAAEEFPGAPSFDDHWLWIGLTKEPGDDQWRWSTGEPATYLNWCPGISPDVTTAKTPTRYSALGYFAWPNPPCWDLGVAEAPGDYLGVIEVDEKPK